MNNQGQGGSGQGGSGQGGSGQGGSGQGGSGQGGSGQGGTVQGGPPPEPGRQCSTLTGGCEEGLDCVNTNGSFDGICSYPCTSFSECPSFWSCVDVSGGGKYCLQD